MKKVSTAAKGYHARNVQLVKLILILYSIIERYKHTQGQPDKVGGTLFYSKYIVITISINFNKIILLL